MLQDTSHWVPICAADQTAIGVVGLLGEFAQRVGQLRRPPLVVISGGDGVGDIGARAVDLGQVADRIVGVGAGQIELAGAGIGDDGLRQIVLKKADF
ncbi:hypothetical protein [Methylomonas sp. MK1]|uniref:hypothetical protein n=1 Tax=Methylomonas sp. MK1 TaxID=1131552 RepID=UPI00035E9CEB